MLFSARKKRIQGNPDPGGNSGQDTLQMDLLEHIDELRRRIIISLCWFVAFFSVALFYANRILGFLRQPLLDALPKSSPATLYYTGPFDIFSAQIKVAFVFSLFIGSPIWLYHIWRFIAPGLPPRQRMPIFPFTVVSSLLFISGGILCYYLMMPAMLRFLIELGADVGTPIITVTDYLSMLLKMLFAFGMFFETPLILVILGLLGIITADQLARHRRIVIVLILILAAVFTSPDPVTQIALAIPTYLLYEASIIAIRLLMRARKVVDLRSVPVAKAPD